MTKFLLSVHVIAAIVAIGPVTVAASMFPPVARRALSDPADGHARSTLRVLHRICRVYAGLGVAVPVFGVATASAMGVLGDAWLITSMVLTAFAALSLLLVILPRQDAVVAALEPGGTGAPGAVSGTALTARATVRLGMATGVFNLLWATVTVLMIVRPGSTTGA